MGTAISPLGDMLKHRVRKTYQDAHVAAAHQCSNCISPPDRPVGLGPPMRRLAAPLDQEIKMSCQIKTRISLPTELLNANAECRFLRWLTPLLSICVRLHERQRQRQALLELDDRLLKDIGITRKRALEAGNKRFWE